MYQKLSTIIGESGIWNGERHSTHAFLLSPSVFTITRKQRDELTSLGHALFKCLLGLSHIAVIVYDSSLNYGGPWAVFRQVFSTGVPQVYHPLQAMSVREITKLLKVDMIIDQNGHLWIAEIDGHNKHGLGYSTLAARFRRALFPEAQALPGVIRLVAEEVKRLGMDQLKLLYGDRERFYLPEFEVARQELGRQGVDCQIISETEATEEQLEDGLFLDLPILAVRENLYSTIISSYRDGRVKFIIPPKPFMGAKALLALLSNSAGNSEVEAILVAFIGRAALDLVRRHIPETLLVGKKATGAAAIKELAGKKKGVLKQSISSGMKGLVFSDEPGFEKQLLIASSSAMDWIFQEEVANQPQTFSWFTNGNGQPPELCTADDWFARLTVQYVNHQLADAVVTARRDRSVHGAKDCIQIGIVVV